MTTLPPTKIRTDGWSKKDKHRAVTLILKDDVLRFLSNREIGRRTNTSPSFVGKLRPILAASREDIPYKRVYMTKHGTVTTMSTANINKQRKVNDD